MTNNKCVFDEHIYQNTISDLSEFLEAELGLQNLNENMAEYDELLYDIDGKELKVSVTFKPQMPFDELQSHPIKDIVIDIEGDSSLDSLKDDISAKIEYYANAYSKSLV